jgi:hypothetical protein
LESLIEHRDIVISNRSKNALALIKSDTLE